MIKCLYEEVTVFGFVCVSVCVPITACKFACKLVITCKCESSVSECDEDIICLCSRVCMSMSS